MHCRADSRDAAEPELLGEPASPGGEAALRPVDLSQMLFIHLASGPGGLPKVAARSS